MKLYNLFIILISTLLCLTSCKEELNPNSVFEEGAGALDPNSYTYEFDLYLQHAYVKPYNIAFQYKLGDETTDTEYNLVPVDYEKAQIVAHAVKYLWIDVYSKHMGPDFLKLYAPRIINVLGSPAMNPSQGTETLGVAEGGIKITLYNMNNINLEDMDWLNLYIFHVMHHEFSHILHQTKSFPKEYEQISADLYDSRGWQYHSDTAAYHMGFVTPYSMSNEHEDFVEVISSYITDTREVWEKRGFIFAEDNTHLVSWHEMDEKQKGSAIINQKINLCKDWLREKYNYELDSIRAEVQRRAEALTYDIVMNDNYE